VRAGRACKGGFDHHIRFTLRETEDHPTLIATRPRMYWRRSHLGRG
jgi:hypothetical protein